MGEILKALVAITTPCGPTAVLLMLIIAALLFVLCKMYKRLEGEHAKYETKLDQRDAARDARDVALNENVNRLSAIIARQRDIIQKYLSDATERECPLKSSSSSKKSKLPDGDNHG